ncbi:acido-empty-quinoprotein group A [Paracidobacterium acidisoli]|uniref:Acido-empty-quinoprotein group A n=1 Tax=Paracidobacterium acidisoli TaxID=2303751 RepID=A0A372IJB8_9BACT|nr:acido-empty-quinoprotein group A [Paracidobacterium acidisoli]MBT9332970.1 acido-empty-quinoprotein group A [Paracidobacterium acidisoli]
MRSVPAVCMAIAAAALVSLAAAAPVASPDPNTIGRPPVTSWPTYNGDYTGQRYSTLTRITPANVSRIAQQWVYQITSVGAQRGAPVPVIKCTPLLVGGVLYITIPDHVWALDAHTGRELWHYEWVDHGGHLIGQRGVAIWRTTVYFLTPDNWLIALNATTGKELWRKNYADARKQYFSTSAPLVVKNHVIVGVGGDAMDMPGFLDSFDPATGRLQWTWWSTPRKDDPALKTWPNEAASEHGGGMTWMPGTYDPKLNLLFWPTGNTNPVFAGQGRPGANLWTESIVALDLDTGRLKWYFQVSPHDTHDFDNTTAPILIDKVVDGKPRRLVSQAARNGFFVTLDRVTGKYLVVRPFVPLDYSSGLSPQGEPIPIPDKDPTVGGSINIVNATNWFAPAYSPKTGLFYVNSVEGKAIYYLVDDSDHPSGYGGTGAGIGHTRRILQAIDPLTGRAVWTHEYPNLNNAPPTTGPALLTTASNLVITGDDQKNLIIFSADKGRILWHQEVAANESGGIITYMLDGRQWILFSAGDSLYAYSLPR